MDGELLSKLGRSIVCYVHVWIPLEISLATERAILVVCLNKVIIIIICATGKRTLCRRGRQPIVMMRLVINTSGKVVCHILSLTM